MYVIKYKANKKVLYIIIIVLSVNDHIHTRGGLSFWEGYLMATVKPHI